MLLQVIGTCKVLQIRGVDRDLSCGSLGGEATGKVLEWKHLELERFIKSRFIKGRFDPYSRWVPNPSLSGSVYSVLVQARLFLALKCRA